MILPVDKSYLSVDWQNPINQNHHLNQGLEAWWLQQPSFQGGTIFRDLTREHNGTLTSMDPSADWVSGGRDGGWGALDFDGTNDNVVIGTDLPETLQLEERTYSAWVNLADATLGTVFGRPTATAGLTDYIFLFLDPNIYIGDGVAGGQVSWGYTSGDFLNKWVHVLATKTGSTLELFFNGISQGTQSMGTSRVTAIGHVGRSPSGTYPRYLTGKVDDLRVWKRALNNSEIAEYYQLSQQGYGGILNRWNRSRGTVSTQVVVGGVSGVAQGFRNFPRGAYRGLNRGVS